jgi:hypothetical protein
MVACDEGHLSTSCIRAGRSISRAGCLDSVHIYFVEVPPLQEHAKVLLFVTFTLDIRLMCVFKELERFRGPHQKF